MRRRSDSLQANLCQAQQHDLKTIAPLLHRPIVLTDTIDYRTIAFLHYRPNPSVDDYYQDGLPGLELGLGLVLMQGGGGGGDNAKLKEWDEISGTNWLW